MEKGKESSAKAPEQTPTTVDAAGEDPGELLESLAKGSESPAKFAIQRIILSFWTEEGKDEAQKIERTVQRLEDVIQSLPGMESKTVAHLNATLDRLPHSSATLLRFAIVHKLVDPAMLEAAIKASDIQKSRTAPTVSKQEKQETDQGAQADPEKQNEVPLEVLEEQIHEARSRIDKMNAARVRMQRDIKHTRLLNARARRYMSPEMRMQQNATMMQEMQNIRSALGDPVADFHRLRAEFERRTNTSWARYRRGTETNVPMTDAPALPEDARRISLRDEESGEVVGVYDEWTGDFSGSMPRAEAVRIVKNQRNAEQNVDGERAVIMVHAPQYVYRPSQSGSESSEWKGEKGSFERYRDVRNFETMMRTNSAYAINTARRRRLGSFARQAGFADMSEAIQNPSITNRSIYVDAIPTSSYLNVTDLDRVTSIYEAVQGDPFAEDVMDAFKSTSARRTIDNTDIAAAISKLASIKKVKDQISALDNASEGQHSLHRLYFEAKQDIGARVDLHITVPPEIAKGQNREIAIHDPKNWLSNTVFGSGDVSLAMAAGIRLQPVYSEESEGGKVTAVEVHFTKPGTFFYRYGTGIPKQIKVEEEQLSSSDSYTISPQEKRSQMITRGRLIMTQLYGEVAQSQEDNTSVSMEDKLNQRWNIIEKRLKSMITNNQLHSLIHDYVLLEKYLDIAEAQGKNRVDVVNEKKKYKEFAMRVYPAFYQALAEASSKE